MQFSPVTNTNQTLDLVDRPKFNVVIIYEDSAAGTRAKHFYNRVIRELVDNATSAWNFGTSRCSHFRRLEMRPRKTEEFFFSTVRKTAPVNRTNEVPDELALIQLDRISTQWPNELRRNIRVCPNFNILRALFSLDVYTQTVVYAFLIKAWSSSRIAQHLDVSLITIQELLEKGREQLKRKLVEPRYSATAA